ncbi:MAG: DUF4164 domain-containing protein, partial [Acidimicrobiia bacterium]|nr:DUF4164 domain-containing protein [Acidimicrobiia bacterium]
MKRVIGGLVVLALVTGACGNSDASSDSSELAEELAAVTAERDALAQRIMADDARLEKTEATIAAVADIVADPTSFGTQEEVLDLLMVHFASEAVMDDDVYGAVPMRTAWRNTLYGLDATIDTWHRWVSEDGSDGLPLWTWSGTNFAGDPFELIGLSILHYSDEGKQDYQFVVYPYEDR